MKLTIFPSLLAPATNPSCLYFTTISSTSNSSHSCCRSTLRRPTAIASSSSSNGGNVEEDMSRTQVKTGIKREARLSARRRESIKLLQLDDANSLNSSSSSSIGDFLRHPAGVESLLNTRALQSFMPLDSHPNTFRCTLHQIQFLNFQVTPVLDLRVTPTHTHCTVEMLSCKFEGSQSIEQQNDLFSAFMRNHITWGENDQDPCLDIEVNLEVTLEVYIKPFSLLPLSAVEKPGNLLMQGLLDRLVPLLGEQLLRDYHAWVEQQSEASS